MLCEGISKVFFNRLFIDQWNLYLIVSGIIIFNQIISLILPRLIIDPSPYYALHSVQDLEFQVGHYKIHKACPCPINQYLSQLHKTVLQHFNFLHFFQAITTGEGTFKTTVNFPQLLTLTPLVLAVFTTISLQI